MAAEIHLNDIGTVFRVTVKDGTVALDVSTATAKTMTFTKPDGTKVTQTAAFGANSGTDGIVEYTSISGDLDILGVWKLQVNLTLSSGTWKSDIESFRVHANL